MPVVATLTAMVLAVPEPLQDLGLMNEKGELPLGARAGLLVLLLLIATGARVGSRSRREAVARWAPAALAVVATLLALIQPVLTPPLEYRRQPSPDAFEYADAARQLVAGNGYMSHHLGQPEPPRYPPGYSAALTPFVALGGPFPASAQFGGKAYAILYVLAVVGLAWRLGGALAAALAAAFVGSSPFARESARVIMSDAFGATLAVLLAGVVSAAGPARSLLAGILMGCLTAVRLGMLVGGAGLALALPRRYWPYAAAGALPFLVGLGALNWHLFGSPLRTGYDYWVPQLRQVDPAYVFGRPLLNDGSAVAADALQGSVLAALCGCTVAGEGASIPNLLFYSAVLLGLAWAFAPPLATLPGLAYLWAARQEPMARFAIWLIVSTLALHSLNYYQAMRYMAAPATLLLIFSAVQVAQWLSRSEPAVARERQVAVTA